MEQQPTLTTITTITPTQITIRLPDGRTLVAALSPGAAQTIATALIRGGTANVPLVWEERRHVQR